MMQHRRRRQARRARGRIALAASGMLASALGCEPEPQDPYGGVRRPAVPSFGVEAPVDVSLDDATELDAACPSALEACGRSPTSPCRVSCQALADGCADVWTLNPVGVLPEMYRMGWEGLDPAGGRGLFYWYWSREEARWYLSEGETLPEDDGDPEYRSWTPEAGAVPISDAVSGADSPFFINDVSQDAVAALGYIGLDPMFWSWESGIVPLPVKLPALAHNGRLVAGQLGRRAARWTPDAGVTEVFTFESDQFRSHAEGGAALFVAGQTLVYSPAAGAPVIQEPPEQLPPGVTFANAALSDDGEHFAVLLQGGGEVYLSVWPEGALTRIDPPPSSSGDPPYLRDLRISADGRVVLVVVDTFEGRRLVRWTAQTGPEVLSDDPNFLVTYLSPAGDVLVGIRETEDDVWRTVRWSVEDGMQELEMPSPEGLVSLDGNVLVTQDGYGPVVHKYGPALGVTLPIEHLRGRVVPLRWFSFALDRVSPDARMLAGTMSDDPGNRWIWVARLETVCPGAP